MSPKLQAPSTGPAPTTHSIGQRQFVVYDASGNITNVYSINALPEEVTAFINALPPNNAENTTLMDAPTLVQNYTVNTTGKHIQKKAQ